MQQLAHRLPQRQRRSQIAGSLRAPCRLCKSATHCDLAFVPRVTDCKLCAFKCGSSSRSSASKPGASRTSVAEMSPPSRTGSPSSTVRARQFSIEGFAFISPPHPVPAHPGLRQFVRGESVSPNTCAGPLLLTASQRHSHPPDKTPFLRLVRSPGVRTCDGPLRTAARLIRLIFSSASATVSPGAVTTNSSPPIRAT